MQTYIFHEGPLPPGATLGYSPAIFNTEAYRSLHLPGDEQSFFLLGKNQSIAYAGVHFFIEDGVARSPLRAPFGSFEFYSQLVPRKLYEFLQYVERQLRHKGVKQILLKNPPHAYAPSGSALLETFLLNQQYSVHEAEVSAVIPVTTKKFAECIRHSEQLRFRQGMEAGFTFQNPGLEKLEEVYRFIAARHGEKGYSLSVSEDCLAKAARIFPERYILSVIRYEESIVAAAVSIRINGGVLYNFLVNHRKEYNTLSPPLMLLDGLYAYCQRHSISLLDLGTSALEGRPHFGLLDFKLHVGGSPSPKLTFLKKTS